MSPEQLDGDALDCRADIYSLAAVLYHLIAGRPPFDAAAAGGADAPDLPRQRRRRWRRCATACRRRCDALIAARRWPSGRERAPRRLGRLRAGAVGADRRPRRCRAGRCRACSTPSASTCCARWSSSPASATSSCGRWCTARSGSATRFGHALYRKGEEGNTFHIIAQGAGRGLPRRPAGGRSSAPAPRWARWPTWRPAPTAHATAPTSWSREPATTISFTPDSAGAAERWPRATCSTRPSSACWCAGCTPRTRRWRTRGASSEPAVAPRRGRALQHAGGRRRWSNRCGSLPMHHDTEEPHDEDPDEHPDPVARSLLPARPSPPMPPAKPRPPRRSWPAPPRPASSRSARPTPRRGAGQLRRATGGRREEAGRRAPRPASSRSARQDGGKGAAARRRPARSRPPSKKLAGARKAATQEVHGQRSGCDRRRRRASAAPVSRAAARASAAVQ